VITKNIRPAHDEDEHGRNDEEGGRETEG
jgi:hypothetical protein